MTGPTANQQPDAIVANPQAAPKDPPKTTRTMDQIDRKLEAHTPTERRVILAYLNAQWGDVQ